MKKEIYDELNRIQVHLNSINASIYSPEFKNASEQTLTYLHNLSSKIMEVNQQVYKDPHFVFPPNDLTYH